MWILLATILVLLFVYYKNNKEHYCAQRGNVIYSTDAIASTCHDDSIKMYFPLDETQVARYEL